MGRERGRESRPAAGSMAPRTCAGCGRGFTWRPSLAAVWTEVRWCSDACRRRGLRPVDTALEAAILELLEARAVGATICPSEAARRVHDGRVDHGEDPEGWRPLLEPARRAARRLVAAGTLEILQQGRVVDPSTAKGPIRLRRARSVG
jgi:hypothetical protein